MRKITRKSIRRKLDSIVSEIVRAKGYCERCKRFDGTLQTAHIFSRKYLNLRWDLDNLLCLDARCHFWAHQNPVEFTEWLKIYIGEIKYMNLRISANETKKWDNYELEELYSALKKYKENMWLNLDR